jgi:4-oxalomesaconate hydratase
MQGGMILMSTVLAISAHAADYVWRAGGTLARYAQEGHKVHVIVLSFGERGESAELWKEPGQTEEQVKQIRRAETLAAAEILGVSIECWDWGDYPIRIDEARLEALVLSIRRIRPQVIITHGHRDPFNPDHPDVSEATRRAAVLAQSPGYRPDIPVCPPINIFGYEHHQPELCDFKPDVIIDITPVFERKRKAMECFVTQQHLLEYYTMRAHIRGNHARRISGNNSYRYAEAFERFFPYVGGELR